MSFRAKLISKLTGDSAFSIADQTLLSGLNFLVGVLAARVLGVEDFGFFALILIIVNLTGSAWEYLLTTPMMTLAGSRPKRSAAYFQAVLRLGLIASIIGAVSVAAIVALLLVMRSEPVSASLVIAVTVLAFGQNLLSKLRAMLFACRRNARALTIDVVRFLLLGLAIAILLAGPWTVDATALFMLLGLSCIVVLIPDAIASTRVRVPAAMYRNVLGRHWSFAKWLLLMMALMMGQEQLLWLIAGFQLGDAAVGALRVGQYLLGTTHVILYALEYFMPRNAAEHHQAGGEDRLRDYLVRQTTIYATVLGLILIVVAIFAEPILALVFGPEYAEFAVYTRILAIYYFLSTIRSIWERYLRTIERTDLLFWSFAVSAAGALAMIYPAMAIWGTAGVAWTIVAGQAIALVLILLTIAARSVKLSAASSEIAAARE